MVVPGETKAEMIWFTQFAIESGCITNDMNEREFKLLVREYFQEMDVIAHIKRNGYVPDLKRRDDLEKQIRKELSRFTEQEQEELPFKD